MPTSLPERNQPEQLPSLRFIVALGAALVVLFGIIASRGAVLAWVRDSRAVFVSDAPTLTTLQSGSVQSLLPRKKSPTLATRSGSD